MAIPTLVTSKVHSHEAGVFSQTTDFSVLHCTNVTGNNNKFYCIEIQENPSTHNFRLFSHYGRLGDNGVYEVREIDKAGDDLSLERCQKEYDKIIKKKQRGKTVKRGADTVREAYAKVDVVTPSVGSSNIRGASSVVVSNKKSPSIDTSNHDSASRRLINTIVQENIHSITSNTTMTFTSRGFETPLGPVTESHLDTATDALNGLRDLLNGYERMDSDDTEVRQTNSEYLTLIPRKVGRIISADDMVITPDDLANEYELIDTLRTAVKAGLSTDSDTPAGMDIDMALLSTDHADWNRLESRFETTKHRNHHAISGYKVKNIFTLDIPDVTKNFRKMESKLGNVEELFHGTKTANMLSIALNGLIIPPTGAAHVTGRMFGNGVYGANCSTKALNYAVGYWGGNQNRSNTAYVLITQFAMGKTHIARRSQTSGVPSGYDSIWAKSGQALLNDELIVYNTDQVTITHILELEK